MMRHSITRGSQGSISHTRLNERDKPSFTKAFAALSAGDEEANDGVSSPADHPQIYESLSNPEILSRVGDNSQVSPSMILATRRR